MSEGFVESTPILSEGKLLPDWLVGSELGFVLWV